MMTLGPHHSAKRRGTGPGLRPLTGRCVFFFHTATSKSTSSRIDSFPFAVLGFEHTTRPFSVSSMLSVFDPDELTTRLSCLSV